MNQCECVRKSNLFILRSGWMLTNALSGMQCFPNGIYLRFACVLRSSQHVYSTTFWCNHWLVRSCSKLERKPLFFLLHWAFEILKYTYAYDTFRNWASSFLAFVFLRVKHVVHPKSGHEMSEKTSINFYSALSLNTSKYCWSQTNSNRNDNLSRKLRSASILTCFRPSRATWRCSMGEFEKWVAKGLPPNN